MKPMNIKITTRIHSNKIPTSNFVCQMTGVLQVFWPWNHTTNKTEVIHCSALVHYQVHGNERNIICLQIYFLQYVWLWDRKNQIQFSTICKVKYWWQHFFLGKDTAVHSDSAFYPVQWVIWDFPAFAVHKTFSWYITQKYISVCWW